jgi:PleD family two-component response regulator
MGMRVDSADGSVGTTASFGLSTLDRTIVDTDALLARADKALYATFDSAPYFSRMGGGLW